MAIGTYMICLDREILKGYTIKANWSEVFTSSPRNKL